LINDEQRVCLRLLNKRDAFDRHIIALVLAGELKIGYVLTGRPKA
jgi:hypothetical protein